MPEGDSLHRLARTLHPKLVGRELKSLRLVRSGSKTEGLAGSKIVGVEARGKNLLVHIAPAQVASGAVLPAPELGQWSFHVHLKMNGRVRIYARGDERPIAMSAASAVLETDQHRVVVYGAPIARLLRTRDLRGDFHLRGLGPDLLGPRFELSEACERLSGRSELPLGEAIMDQGVVAGIGNVWKSELCFTLRLDPFAQVSAFSADELSALLSLARTQMTDTVYGPVRTLPDPFTPRAQRKTRVDRRQGEKVLSVYGRAGEPCYDCGVSIEMRRQGEQLRSTYYCPQCQPSRGAA
jgi:endonuclease VIII